MDSLKQLNKLALQNRRVLSQQEIRPGNPGTILSDMQTLLEFIGTGGLATQSNRGNLPNVVLPELNAKLSQPLELRLTRPLLRDYPNIAGLYVLARVMNLVRADGKRVCVDNQALELWSGLNPTEKYFALFEAWLIHANDAVLGGSGRSDTIQSARNIAFLAAEVGSSWKSFGRFCHVDSGWRGISAWNVQLQARFGLIEVQPLPFEGRDYPTGGWIMGNARRTEWGTAVVWTLLLFLEQKLRKGKPLWLWLWQPLPEEADFGYFRPPFRIHFPEWQRVYGVKVPEFVAGLHRFKVTLDPRYYGRQGWRRLAVPAEASLHEVAQAILKAFNFWDDDHLYTFSYREQSGKPRAYNHPQCEEGPFADGIQVGELKLADKEAIKFRFDFGDDWRFLLRLERIDPPNPELKAITLAASEGEVPKQYPNMDE